MSVYIGFAVLSALLLWAVIYARGPWALKLALILTVPAYGVFVWHSVEQWRGYPVHAKPPEAQFVASLVAEPDYIYLWVVLPGASEPRAYRQPYSRQLHESVVRAGQRQAAGQGRIGLRYNAGRWQSYQLPAALPSKSEGP